MRHISLIIRQTQRREIISGGFGKWLVTAVTAIALLSRAIGHAWAQSPLDILVGSGSGQPGDPVIVIPVSMECSGTSPIASSNFDLNFDANTLTLTGVTGGSSSALKTVDSLSYSGYERIIIYGGRSLMPCGTLANVSFNVRANAPSGQTDLTLSAYIFSNPDATSVPVNIQNGSFQVPTPTHTPVPPTNTPTPSNTPVPPTATNSATPGPSPTPSLTPTSSMTPTPSNTSPPTATHTPGPSPTASSTPSGTLTPSPTATVTLTLRATTTRTPPSKGAGEGLELEGGRRLRRGSRRWLWSGRQGRSGLRS